MSERDPLTISAADKSSSGAKQFYFVNTPRKQPSMVGDSAIAGGGDSAIAGAEIECELWC